MTPDGGLFDLGATTEAVVRCQLHLLIIFNGMTGGNSLILPLMVGNIIADEIAPVLQPVGTSNALLLQESVRLRRLPVYRGAQDHRRPPCG